MAESNTNIWKWMVTILVILNIVLIVTIWCKPMNGLPHHGPGPGEGGPAKMIIEELKLTQAQIQEFEKLKEEHHSSIMNFERKGKKFRDTFFDVLKQEKPDEKLAEQMADSISMNQKAIEWITFKHFEKVKQLCNTEQKKRFDEIIGEVLHFMAGPHGRRPPPH